MTGKSLSKNLLQMKFMQRSKVRIEAEISEKISIEEHQFLQPKQRKSKFVVEPRIAVLENLLECGRLSFQGFNPEVEKCMAHHEELKKEKTEKKAREHQGKDVDDREMAVRFSSISKNIAKKFTKKRHRTNVEDQQEDVMDDQEDTYNNTKDYRPKRKFRKPND